jgi:hypothetical protein
MIGDVRFSEQGRYATELSEWRIGLRGNFLYTHLYCILTTVYSR